MRILKFRISYFEDKRALLPLSGLQILTARTSRSADQDDAVTNTFSIKFLSLLYLFFVLQMVVSHTTFPSDVARIFVRGTNIFPLSISPRSRFFCILQNAGVRPYL